MQSGRNKTKDYFFREIVYLGPNLGR